MLDKKLTKVRFDSELGILRLTLEIRIPQKAKDKWKKVQCKKSEKLDITLHLSPPYPHYSERHLQNQKIDANSLTHGQMLKERNKEEESERAYQCIFYSNKLCAYSKEAKGDAQYGLYTSKPILNTRKNQRILSVPSAKESLTRKKEPESVESSLCLSQGLCQYSYGKYSTVRHKNKTLKCRNKKNGGK